MDLKQIDQFAKSIIVEAGNRIRNAFSYNLVIETKSNANDLVTESRP
ncbi:Fructose-1, 6-bisphosphatase/inositol-1-monophosphatase OS=Lysinibacillus sphaericus OX=1421 GN=suhB PE=4 SV=1 [Lysinibacillus sphaericus]